MHGTIRLSCGCVFYKGNDEPSTGVTSTIAMVSYMVLLKPEEAFSQNSAALFVMVLLELVTEAQISNLIFLDLEFLRGLIHIMCKKHLAKLSDT